MKKIYCLSGLGVDHRVFNDLRIKGFELEHIEWIKPEKNEVLSSYAKRLFDNAEISNEYYLLGLSFGGMVAQEFAKIRKPKKLILISTINGNHELSSHFKLACWLGLNKLVPNVAFKMVNRMTYYLFGIKRKQDKTLFKKIMKDTNPAFLGWCINALLKWKNTEKLQAYHLHGSKDRLLPVPSGVDHTIEGSGHFLVVTHAEVVSNILSEYLDQTNND